MLILTSFFLVLGISAVFGFLLLQLTISITQQFCKKINLTSPVKVVLFFAFYFLSQLAIPFPIPQVTLSNGDQTIVAQGMVHIGKTDFYKKIQDDATAYRNHGYVIVHEGIGLEIKEDTNEKCILDKEPAYIVQPICIGDLLNTDKVYEPSKDKLRELIINYLSSSVDDNEEPYITKEQATEIANFATNQSSKDTYQFFKPSLFTMNLIKTLFLSTSLNTTFMDGKTRSASETQMTKDKSEKIIKLWNNINSDDEERDKKFDKLSIMALSMPDEVTLDYRNKLLGDGLLSLKQNAYVMYGMRHLPRLYAYLKSQDSQWEVTDINFINATPWF